MVCVAGEMLTTPDGFAASATVTLEPVGTGCVKVTVALKLRLMARSGPSVARFIACVPDVCTVVTNTAPYPTANVHRKCCHVRSGVTHVDELVCSINGYRGGNRAVREW